MPIRLWNTDASLNRDECIKNFRRTDLVHLEPAERTDPQQPAVDYRFVDGKGVVGFINSVSEPFCQTVQSNAGYRGRHVSKLSVLNPGMGFAGASPFAGRDEVQIEDRIRECVHAKKTGHGIDSEDFVRPQKAMYQIGG